MTKTLLSFCLLATLVWQPITLSARGSFPLETIYAQTDKQNYFTGETIWFRAYLVNSQTHVQDTLSRYVYAELINSQREVKNRVMIRHENGVFAGHILVTENLEAGDYILRFFTRHLESFGEEYFFQRAIHIITPESLEEAQAIATPAVNNDFAVSFHPEGGDIPAGVYTRVAFKALNSSGLGEDVNGTVVNARGDIVTEFESVHLGMGYFVLMADRNEQLFANIRNAAGVEKRFELPQAREDAISLQVFRQDENVIIHLPYLDNSTLYLTLQHRGHVLYSERWDTNSKILIIPEDNLPTGVIGIVLSDARGIPISKRQIFNISRLDIVNTTFTTDRESYGVRERVNATVSVTDSENRPLRASFSISVIDNDIAHYDAAVNILSTLLLTSDLRGHIEAPAYYFMPENENAKAHLDLVILTHGWSRFEVSRVEQEAIIHWDDFGIGQVITGYLQGTQRRIANQSVTVLVPEFDFFDEVQTDREGRFRFENFEFPEGTQFVLQGNSGTQIRINPEPFPTIDNVFIPVRANFEDEQREEMQRFMHDDGMWLFELDEFVVRGFRTRARNVNQHAFSSPFNQRRDREELGALRADNLQQLLQQAFPALGIGTWGTTSIDISRSTTFDAELARVTGESTPQARATEPPLIFIDGVEFSFPMLRNLSANNVESIEFARTTADRAIWGLRAGYSGVIIITTGDPFVTFSALPNVTMIVPLGYQITREFFAPAYTTDAQRQNPRADLRTTIFWNPNVTTHADGNARIHFYTSDNVGNYVVIIEGITDEGGIVHTIGRVR